MPKLLTKTDTVLGPQRYQNRCKDINTAQVRAHEPTGTTAHGQIILVLAAAIAIAAIGSHFVASWVKVKTKAAQPFTFENSSGNPPAFLAGSSVANYGISWEQISTQLNTKIRVWGIAGGSPFEWEQFQKQVPEAQTTIIIVSAIDLDEAL